MPRLIFFIVLLLSFACSDRKTTAVNPASSPAQQEVAINNSLSITQEESPQVQLESHSSEPASKQTKPTISGKSPRITSSKPKEVSPTLSRSGKTTAASASTVPTATAEAPASASKPTETTPPAAPDHQAFDALLQQYVDSQGQVNYTAFKKTESQLDAYLNTLALATPGAGWTKNEALAYWMNAYNAYTLKLILKNWPLSSILDLHGGKPWDVNWIELAGKTYSLNEIEHQIIRPQFKDARIHFAVNCAAKSCPPLYNRAFSSQGLNSTLERLTKAFINNEAYNKTTSTTVQVSKLFDWYKEDFGDVRAYLNTYLNTPLEIDSSIGFSDYDWALNGR